MQAFVSEGRLDGTQTVDGTAVMPILPFSVEITRVEITRLSPAKLGTPMQKAL